MGRQLMHTEMHRNPRDYSQINEVEILADIQYFQEQMAQLPVDADRYTRARRQVYQTLLQQRRQLLSATRAGKPADWPSFSSKKR